MSPRHVINVCFHGIGSPGRDLEPGEARYWVTPDRFRALLDEVMTWPAARISFDDSNYSDLDAALPALTERGLAADVFVVAGRLDQPGSLGAGDVRELHRRGMRIGSHGLHHRPWRRLDAAGRHAELVLARQRLAEVVGAPVDLASCPLGRYDRRVLAELRRLGYATVFTSDRRPSRPGAWLQPRYSVYAHDTPASLRRTVLGQPGQVRRAVRAGVGVVKRLR